LDISIIKDVVCDAYGINIFFVEKNKNVYKLQSKDKTYCLKVINYNLGHFLFILGAIRHLQNNGFDKIPDIIKTKSGSNYICISGKYAYLTDWLNCRQSNYDNPVDLSIAASKLAELHVKSEGFRINKNMDPRIGWLKWMETFTTRISEIIDFKERILKKGVKTEFDLLYIKDMSEELDIADSSIINLYNSDYIYNMKKEIARRGFCHHDYAHHNILIDKSGNANVIDFDYCILDSHLHDLSSLMLRRLKNSKWDLGNAYFIMESYSSIKEVKNSDIPIMAAFMEFPQDYWQLGIQYYWENKDWDEEVFISKLNKIYEDREEKHEFLHDLRRLKF